MAWGVSDMIHRLHYRYLNSYLAFYFQKAGARNDAKAKIIQVEKTETLEITRSKIKLMSAMAWEQKMRWEF